MCRHGDGDKWLYPHQYKVVHYTLGNWASDVSGVSVNSCILGGFYMCRWVIALVHTVLLSLHWVLFLTIHIPILIHLFWLPGVYLFNPILFYVICLLFSHIWHLSYFLFLSNHFLSLSFSSCRSQRSVVHFKLVRLPNGSYEFGNHCFPSIDQLRHHFEMEQPSVGGDLGSYMPMCT